MVLHLMFPWIFTVLISAPAQDLGERIQAVLELPGYETARWGLLVVDAETGETLYARNPDQLFRPASVTKLFSCAAALTRLGAEHRFVTAVVRRGEVSEAGELDGDLILISSGDMSLGGRTGSDGSLLYTDVDHSYASPISRAAIVPADPLAGLDHLAREIQAAGVRQVNGEVIVDDRLFDAAPSTGSGPRVVTPIIVNDNLIDVVVSPHDQAGQPAEVRIVPETAYVAFDVQVETVEPGKPCLIHVDSVGPRRFQVRGTIPVGAGPSYHAYEVEEPASFARTLLIEALRRRGVRITGSPLNENPTDRLPDRESTAALPKLAEYTSPPFKEYVKVILKVSQNLHASTLPLLLAVADGKRTLGDGLRAEGNALRQLGIDVATISFGGGAGGSPVDLVTPRATVSLLRAMATRPEYPAFEAALPILGRDGTLAQSVTPESPARGHVRAKTGTFYLDDGLTGKTMLTSKALAGYMETASGRKLVFAAFLNDIPLRVANGDVQAATAAAGRVLGQLCEVLYTATPSAAAGPVGGSAPQPEGPTSRPAPDPSRGLPAARESKDPLP
jgi:D-alanyl-D-alanine carboxypeptidase/D-alanyl-D-alanine-endopeptidase (penicillin-binding protein 4)